MVATILVGADPEKSGNIVITPSYPIKCMQFEVRKAGLKDLPSILAMSLKLFEYERQWGKMFNMKWTYSKAGKSYFQSRIKAGEVLVANVDAKPVGYLACHAFKYPFRSVNPLFELENMYVEEAFRGKGLGEKLVASFKLLAKERGAKRIQVGSIFQNAGAIMFYKKMGFMEFETILEASI